MACQDILICAGTSGDLHYECKDGGNVRLRATEGGLNVRGGWLGNAAFRTALSNRNIDKGSMRAAEAVVAGKSSRCAT